MFKFLALIVIFAVVVSVNAFPAAEEDRKIAQGPLPPKPDDADLEASDDSGASEGSDLKPAETFGFGFYPSYGYGGRGWGGYGGYGRYGGYGGYHGHSGYRYGSGYGGWGGYKHYGYSSYPSGYYW